MATRPEQLYEEDFYAWTRGQAKALRRLKATRPNVDLDHLIEEVEDLGKSERDPPCPSTRCRPRTAISSAGSPCKRTVTSPSIGRSSPG